MEGADMTVRWGRHINRFAAFQLGDAVACAIPLAYIERDLDNISCPPTLRRALPPIKAASAVGLVLGRRWPLLGRITAWSLVGYFCCAIGFHVRAKDPVWKSLPAGSLLVTSAVLGTPADRPGAGLCAGPAPPFRADSGDSAGVTEGLVRLGHEHLAMRDWPLNVRADIIEAAAVCDTAIAATPMGTLSAFFLEDAHTALSEAQYLLTEDDIARAIDELYNALGLLSDAIDASDVAPPVDLASIALTLASRAIAAASAL
jgi:hypothetical protein